MTRDDAQEGAGSGLADRWQLAPRIDFLNHGSFGACPTAVLERQASWRAELEREPVRFLVHRLEGLLDEVRAALAPVGGVVSTDLAFVPNATYAVNSVVRSWPLEAGDEILCTDHEYNACRNVLDFVAGRRGAKVVVAKIPFPLGSADEVVAAVTAAVTDHTRLALLDHITSQTGLVMPVDRLVTGLMERGVEVVVDGAHGVGQLDLDLDTLGAAAYTSNCHKWLCAPKGAACLWVRPDLQDRIRPACISHGANSPRTDRSRYSLEFDWTGTADPTPILCIPDAIRFCEGLFNGGLPALRTRNRALALYARDRLCRALEIPAPAPDDMIAQLAAVPLPDGAPDPLQDALYARGIEVPIVPWPAPPKRLVRISAQAYNTRAQYDRLAVALQDLL